MIVTLNKALNKTLTKSIDRVLSKEALRKVESQIDNGFERVISHPTFLRSASFVINFDSYRRIWTRRALQRALMSLELPVRSDQERMLALLEQLNARVEDLETSTTPSPSKRSDTAATKPRGMASSESQAHDINGAQNVGL